MKLNLILCLIFVSIVCFSHATTYLVKQNGHGDFTTIQAAINASAQSGDTIIVYPGIYNECLYIDYMHDVIIQSTFPQTHSRADIERTVINCSNFGLYGILIKSNGTLDGFTIQNDSGDGIHLYYNWANGYVPYVYTINNCIISHNAMNGIRLFNDNAEYHINNCEITDNGADGVGQDEFVVRETANRIYNSHITNSLIAYNYGYGVFSYWDVKIRNCTISRNDVGVLANTTNLTTNTSYINNSIVYGNYSNSIERWIGSPYPQISFSDIRNYPNAPANQGIIDEDPCFVDTDNNDFSLAWETNRKSPCIDTGDPSPVEGPLLDPDGTRHDMGYKPVTQEKDYSYYFHGTDEVKGGWTWLCYPVLDVYGTNPQIGNVMATVMGSHQLDHEEWSIQNQPTYFQFIPNQGWSNSDYTITSPQGFKVQLNSPEYYGFLATAPRCPENTPIHLYGPVRSTGKYINNWVGYFLPFSQTPEEALSSILPNVYSISTQTWAMARYANGWLYTGSRIRQFNDGDMVILQCYNEIPNFVWNQGTRIEPAVREKTQYFTYTEQADYLPVFVALGDDPGLKEVAVYADGICKGAAVVEDSLMEVNAYVMDLPEGTELEIVKYYESKAVPKHISTAYVYDPDTQLISQSKIRLHKADNYLYVGVELSYMQPQQQVSLQMSCYPNPFNPNTCIEYKTVNAGTNVLQIYNLRGQLVKTLLNGWQNEGSYKMHWDGKNENEKNVGSGVYFARLKANGSQSMKKLMLLK